MYRMKTLLVAVLAIGFTHLYAQETYIVDLSGTGDFTTIHEAVDEAESGDTIRVQPDQYAFTADLGPVTVDKRLVIIGSGYMPVEDGGTELIDIPGTGYFNLTASADGTVIKGFRVQGAYYFVQTEGGTANITIEENLLIGESNIIELEGTADTVRSNVFSSTSRYTVLSKGTKAQITNNIFTQSSYLANGYSIIDIRSGGSGVVVAYNLFLNAGSAGGSSAAVGIYAGSPEIYSNGFVNQNGNSIYNGTGTAFVTNNGFYNSNTAGLNIVDEAPDFTDYDADNDLLDLDLLNENSFDLSLADGSEWIDMGRPGTTYLDIDGSRSDIGIYAGPVPFSNGRGAPSVPVVINFQVAPTTVSPSGTITITATGRIGDGSN